MVQQCRLTPILAREPVRQGQEVRLCRGDIINCSEPTEKARLPNPQRLVKAYNQSAATLNLLRGFATGAHTRAPASTRGAQDAATGDPWFTAQQLAPAVGRAPPGTAPADPVLSDCGAGGYAGLQRVMQWNLDFMARSDQGEQYLELAQVRPQSAAPECSPVTQPPHGALRAGLGWTSVQASPECTLSWPGACQRASGSCSQWTAASTEASLSRSGWTRPSSS